MAYNRTIYKKVAEQLTQRREQARTEADRRRRELHEKFPEIAKIDDMLSKTGSEFFAQTLNNTGDVAALVEHFRSNNLRNQQIRADILAGKGYPADYTKPHYSCALCNDSGYVGIDMCSCMKSALSKEQYLANGLGHLSEHQTFETFDLGMYSNTDGKNGKLSSRAIMERTYNSCVKFAEGFEGHSADNFFIIGSVGCGKTHLTASIAKRVIEQGFDVIFDTAQTILYNFEKERFNRADEDEKTDRYFEADMLIIDDLGTEYSGNMTALSLFNIINHRTTAKKSTVISTNLNHAELQKKYDARVISRLFGEFCVLTCASEDIRLKKRGIGYN